MGNFQKWVTPMPKFDHQAKKSDPGPRFRFRQMVAKPLKTCIKTDTKLRRTKFAHENEQKHIAPGRKNGRRQMKSWTKECKIWWPGGEKVPPPFGEGSWGERRGGCRVSSATIGCPEGGVQICV